MGSTLRDSDLPGLLGKDISVYMSSSSNSNAQPGLITTVPESDHRSSKMVSGVKTFVFLSSTQLDNCTTIYVSLLIDTWVHFSFSYELLLLSY